MAPVMDDALDEVPLGDEDSVEFRVLMVYAQRTLPGSEYQRLMGRGPAVMGDGAACNGGAPSVSGSSSAVPKKKKKKRWSRKFTPKCLRPPREEEMDPNLITYAADDEDDVRVGGVVQRLKTIVQELESRAPEGTQFRALRRMPSVQPDGDGEDDLIEDIVRFLRAEGDKMNKEMMQEQNFLQRLQNFWSYGFFQRLTETYVAQMVPASDPEDARQSSKIALCVHATAKLTALDSHPMNRMFGFGAKYLKENYSQWIKAHGGWEKVMGIPAMEEEELED